MVQKNLQRLVETNGCPACDLAGAVLNRIDLSGANLEGANLAGTRLYLADLSGANLRNANLQSAGLGGADLARADLRGANLTGAVLEGAYLKDALMDGVVTTRHSADEEGVTGAGETVVVGDDSRSKHKPYTQDVVVAPRQDLSTMPDAEAMPVKEKAAVVQGGDQAGTTAPTREQQVPGPGQGPKRLSPMADAVVPATVVPAMPEHGAGEVVELAAVAKKKVAAAEAAQAGPAAPVADSGATPLPRQQVTPAAGRSAGSSGESVGPPAGDWQGRQAGSGGTPAGTKEVPAANRDAMVRGTETRDIPGAGEKAAAEVGDEKPVRTPEPEQAAAAEAAGHTRASAGAAAGSGNAEAVAESTGAGRAADAAAAGTMGQEAAAVKATVQEVAVTVVGPQPAADRRQVLVERLLDENQCPECDLQGADLSGRRLGNADLERADLRGANLEEADLENANLKGADLRGANLRKADLRGADLYLARLGGADLTGARMEGTLVDSADFTGAVGVPIDLDVKEE